MRLIKLASWDDFPQRIVNIARSLEIIYSVRLSVDFGEIFVERLFPTEDSPENDKLAIVFEKKVRENYSVLIIVVKRNEDFSSWMVIIVPSYKKTHD
jgi:hypothetical protein